jgi:hypothetical protein
MWLNTLTPFLKLDINDRQRKRYRNPPKHILKYDAVRHPALPLYDAHSDINLPTYSDVM